jgi:hypothetical protein
MNIFPLCLAVVGPPVCILCAHSNPFFLIQFLLPIKKNGRDSLADFVISLGSAHYIISGPM